MPHIHTQPGQHDHTASAYIIRIDLGEPKLLLHKHKKRGLYQQFGGHIELHENPWQAVTHEAEEESGYTMDQLKILQPHDRIRSGKQGQGTEHPVAVSHNTHSFDNTKTHYHSDIGYAFVTEQEPAKSVSDGESNDFMLLTRQELVDFPSDKVSGGIKVTGFFIFDVCLPKWEAVDPTEFSR
jgi:8-oxo-dGTP pyrophosphatase MutT (NUDIX family)